MSADQKVNHLAAQILFLQEDDPSLPDDYQWINWSK